MNKNQKNDTVSEKIVEEALKTIRDVFDRDVFDYGGEITFESLSEKEQASILAFVINSPVKYGVIQSLQGVYEAIMERRILKEES